MLFEFETPDIPWYSRGGWGFADKTSFMPERKVEICRLFWRDQAVRTIQTEAARYEGYHKNMTNYDFGGMVFRVDVKPGAYRIFAECTAGKDKILMSVSGTHPDKIQDFEYWDAAGLIPNGNRAVWEGNVWSYSFVTGVPYLELEIEPLKPDVEIGVRKIRIEAIEEAKEKNQNSMPVIYILGDSTAKSYVFEEAPMSGWGQCFYRMIDDTKTRIRNYSNGGRSLKSMYMEGRLNDLLLNGRKGDYVFLQSGHNDERARNDGVDPDGEQIRYGGGSTEEMYRRFLSEIFAPSIRCRGMVPIFVTPVTRIDGDCGDNAVFENSFTNRRFPQIMRETGKKLNIPVIDLNAKSVEYFNQIGPIAAKALVMAVEPGETPGKTNSGSYANGNPFNHPDGTHYKEGLSKQYCRMAAEEIYRLKMEGLWIQIDKLYDLLSPKVKKGVKTGDFSQVFPEVCADTERGPGSYYRNQIEKMVQLGVFHKDQKGCFYPWKLCGEGEFYRALKQLWNLPEGFTPWEKDRPLTRKRAAFMLYDGYVLRFGLEEKNKPPYMTDYNDISISPDDPNYDSNIPLGATIYYPLVPFEKLEDMEELTKEEKTKVEAVYRLGLMRSEQHIRRGSLKNGRLFQPDLEVTREKAAKLLYFCFVLKQNVKKENHRIDD